MEDLSERIAEEVVSASGGFWQVDGPPTAGKSAVLRKLSEHLSNAGHVPITVAPPARALDAGPVALIQVGEGLQDAKVINGQLKSLTDPTRSLEDKLGQVAQWLEKAEGKGVLLCDEPSTWPVRDRTARHFAEHAYEVWALLSTRREWSVVATGDLPIRPVSARRHSVTRTTPSLDWLQDREMWGPLADDAAALAERIDLTRRSPLEARLLVALAAVVTIDELTAWLSPTVSRRAISERLIEELTSQPRFAHLCRAWKRLALIREPIPDDLLERLTGSRMSGLAESILRNCILYRDGTNYVLHDTLRLDAWQRWRMDRALTTYKQTLRQLAEHYASRTTLRDAMEAFHFAANSGDDRLIEGQEPFFAAQLDVLGRTLSYDLKRYADAVKVFERAIELDPADDYAHHYKAFNLDVQGCEPDEVEAGYTKAIELEPDHIWWRSRYVAFLVTRGRIEDARAAWDDAVDALLSPDGNDDLFLFETLHLWVVKILLHRSQLDFAEEVLSGIPDAVFEASSGLAAARRRYRALAAAYPRGAFAPMSLLADLEWWRHGPALLQRQLEGKRALVSWLPGRVEEVADDEVTLRILDANDEDSEPKVGWMAIGRDDFDTWSGDDLFAEINPGRFVEIGLYAPAEQGDDLATFIRVHKPTPSADEGLWVSPAPTRYLTAATD